MSKFSSIFNVDQETLNTSWKVMERADLTDTSHAILCIYVLVILLLGLLGNLFVLYSSLKHQALHLDKASLVMVHFLAVSDIIANVLIFLPMFVTLVAKRWVMGSGICGFVGFFFITPLHCDVMIILSASVYKMWMISRGSAGNINTKTIYTISAVNVLISLFLPVYLISTGVAGSDEVFVEFDPQNIQCFSSNMFPREPYSTFTMYYVAVMLGVPLFLILSINCAILVIVWATRRKVGRGVPRQTLVVLSAVSWLFIASYLPVIVMAVWFLVGENSPPSWFQVFLMCSLGINISCNPLVYAASNRRFRRHVAVVCPFAKTKVTSNSIQRKPTSGPE